MAKAKSGGTRSYLRGRVGSDVYSIGKDAKGNKQQIVRSLAESVANPQTLAQMRGRMIMSTIMQAVSSMAVIVDHSFDNVPAGQPNISEFIKRNYALVKADVAAHPASENAFGLVKYGEKGIKQGAFVIASGSAADVAGVAVDASAKTLTIALSSGATIADLRSALGIGTEDYFTLCSITADGKFIYERFHVTTALPSATAISSDNLASVITLDGNTQVTLSLSGGNIVATLGNMSENYGIIVSRKENASYKHNDCVLAAPTAPEFTSDDALPTYPTGSQRFLNGGGEEVAPFSPEPVINPIELTALQTNGHSANVGGFWSNGSNPLTDDPTGPVTFTAANVAANGGAVALLSATKNYDANGTNVGTLTDGENTLKSRTWTDGCSVWIKPATGSEFMLFRVVVGGD